jgi:hypothetical protein
MPGNGGKKMRLSNNQKRQIDELNHAGEGILAIADYLDIPPDVVQKHLKKAAENRAEKLSGAVFMIGLGILFVPGIPVSFCPGIFFVLAIVTLLKGLAGGAYWSNLQGAGWLVGIGVVLQVGFNLPALLILIGVFSLMGYLLRPRATRQREVDGYEKRKNDERRASEVLEYAYEKPKRGMLRLADDGEMIEIVDEDEAYQRRS